MQEKEAPSAGEFTTKTAGARAEGERQGAEAREEVYFIPKTISDFFVVSTYTIRNCENMKEKKVSQEEDGRGRNS